MSYPVFQNEMLGLMLGQQLNHIYSCLLWWYVLFPQETLVAANQLKTPSRVLHSIQFLQMERTEKRFVAGVTQQKQSFFLFSVTLAGDTIFSSIVKKADFLQLCARRSGNVNLYHFSRKHAFTPAFEDNPDHKVKCDLCTFVMNP